MAVSFQLSARGAQTRRQTGWGVNVRVCVKLGGAMQPISLVYDRLIDGATMANLATIIIEE
jgi:hypothetical protein